MGTIDIKYRAYNFAVSLLKFVNKLEVNRTYYPLMNQLVRSSTSIGANIIEGKAGSSRKDMINYYKIALKSGNETKYWLCLLRDTMGLRNTEITSLIKEADEITKIIASSILTLEGKSRKSPKQV